MPEPARISLQFGALCDDIFVQLRQQNIDVSKARMHPFQLDAEAINRLAIRGLLPDSQVRAARKKLMKQILAELK